MQTVNWALLNDILNPIGGTADMDGMHHKYEKINSNDQVAVKKVILEEIEPYYDLASDVYKNSLKSSLSYFLTTNRIDFGRLYDSCLIAFEHPTDAKLFFIWIWEVLFPSEDYHLLNPEVYLEIEDFNEPANLWNYDK